MNTIVMNTINAAVTEHQLDANSITANYIANGTAIYARGGDKDGASDIDALVMTGRTDWGSAMKKTPERAFVGVSGAGAGAVVLETERGVQYACPTQVLASGESTTPLPRGFRETRFAFGYRNKSGADFRLDSIELITAQSDTRRT